jgi:hypothetical protein
MTILMAGIDLGFYTSLHPPSLPKNFAANLV